MSYLSTSENVGFSSIPQNISDASCATQYKMAVEGVSGSGEVNIFIHDSSGDEQTYVPHLNDNFFHSKFKIDPNELYTFHDSDVIAGEITVSHTEDNLLFPDDSDRKQNVSKDSEFIVTNGDLKEEIKEVVSNGHYLPEAKALTVNPKTNKTPNTKVAKVKNQSILNKEQRSNSVTEARRPSIRSPRSQSGSVPLTTLNSSINSINASSIQKPPGNETFLDVFKREQGLYDESVPVKIKSEPDLNPVQGASTNKISAQVPKKVAAPKVQPQLKVKRGRGPAVHEALQRIPQNCRVLPLTNRAWHAPGGELFQCGPLEERRPYNVRQQESSSDDDIMPEFEAGTDPICVEETAAESRGARLALRRAALRRHVARADTALRLARDWRDYRTLATVIKKQLNSQSVGQSRRIPTQTVNHLLAMRDMPSVFTSQERRQLRESGWSGGESVSEIHSSTCAEDRCTQPPLPCGRYCLCHVTSAPEQKLYAACAAVFAGGARCKQPLLPLQDQTPLCAEHAWKRDNYDKLCRDIKRPVPVARKRVNSTPRARHRGKRRRVNSHVASRHTSLSEINVCSNSSAYDSSEETVMGGAISDNEYIVVANSSNELEVEVGSVPPDDILDPAVLSQIPDEAFTEFFNQAEGAAPFAESSELAAALEAVLDERGLDERALDNIDCVFIRDKEKLLAPSALLGHDSSIATVTNMFPDLVKELVKSVKTGDVARAKELQEKLNGLVKGIAAQGDFVPTMKVAMEMLTGIKVGPPRQPLCPLDLMHRSRIEVHLTQMGYRILSNKDL